MNPGMSYNISVSILYTKTAYQYLVNIILSVLCCEKIPSKFKLAIL